MKVRLLLAGLAAGLLFHAQIGLAAEPKDVPKDIKHILGLYFGNGENILIREKQGQLELLYRYAQKDMSFAKANIYPLEKERFDAYLLQEKGPMASAEAKVRFERDKDGYGISCRVGGNTYTRYFFGYGVGERPREFRLPPLSAEAWASLRQQAEAQPMEPALTAGKKATLVAASAIEGLKVRSVYATEENCFGAPLYTTGELYVSTEVAAALTKIQAKLAPKGYGLVLWDAYRPWSVSYLAHSALPKEKKTMLPSPKEGSSHNTGQAVDVGLYDLATGLEVDLGCGFDEPSPRQYTSYAGGTSRQRYLRQLLREVMEEEAFKSIEMEWWHFEYAAAEKWAHLNLPLESLSGK